MLAFFLAMMGPFTLYVGLEIEIIFVHIGDNTKITTNQEILHIKRHLLFETPRKKKSMWTYDSSKMKFKVWRCRESGQAGAENMPGDPLRLTGSLANIWN